MREPAPRCAPRAGQALARLAPEGGQPVELPARTVRRGRRRPLVSWIPEAGAPAPAAPAEPELAGRLTAWHSQEFLRSYVRWREACEEVRLAYERSETAERPDRRLAFAAFCAALDREEHAAALHADTHAKIRAELGQ